MERKIFKARPAGDPKRRFEWASLFDGDVCLWELTVSEANQVAGWATRPSIDPRGGMDIGLVHSGLLVLSAHTAEPEDKKAERIFADIEQVLGMPHAEFRVLLETADRVNGKGMEAEAEAKAFFNAAPDSMSGEPTSSASNNSADCPVS